MGTTGGGTTGNARASVRVPFMIDAPGITGTLGTLQVPFLISGNVSVDFGIPVTPFAPWPGDSSGDGLIATSRKKTGDRWSPAIRSRRNRYTA